MRTLRPSFSVLSHFLSLFVRTYQINRKSVDRLKNANLLSKKSEKSKADLMVSTKLSYQVCERKREGKIERERDNDINNVFCSSGN